MASGRPLPSKLGIREGSTLALVHAPEGVIVGLPAGVSVRYAARGQADVVVAFFTARARLAHECPRLGRMIFPAGALWLAWPKRASGLSTDISDKVVREVALPTGLVDNLVCAIDDTWSALRVVWRRERRC
jgi:hypothetical protein